MADPLQVDVAVVGAGPAGLAAAWAAASRGKRVALLDEQAAPGGQIWRSPDEASLPSPAASWFAKARSAGVNFLAGHSVVACPGGRRLIASTAGGPRHIAFEKLILATGAREWFVPFPGWTLPGVYGAGGLQALVKAGLSVKGKRIVVAGTGPLLHAVAAYLKAKGAEIPCVAEQTPASRFHGFVLGLVTHPLKLFEGALLRSQLLSIPLDLGWWPTRAEGDERLSSVTLTDGRREMTHPCDMLACGFGLVPNVELPALLGCALSGGFVQVGPACETSVPGVYAIGELVAIGGADAAVLQGVVAGAEAAGDSKPARRKRGSLQRWRRFADRMASAFELRPELRGDVGDDTPVCRCEDVTLRMLKQHDNWRDAKLQTRIGMGPCQGRICGAACRFLLGWSETSTRPPVLPARVDDLIEPS